MNDEVNKAPTEAELDEATNELFGAFVTFKVSLYNRLVRKGRAAFDAKNNLAAVEYGLQAAEVRMNLLEEVDAFMAGMAREVFKGVREAIADELGSAPEDADLASEVHPE